MKIIKNGGHRLFENDPETARIVSAMLLELERDGMDAVRRYSEKFDAWSPPSFELTADQIAAATAKLDPQIISDTAFCQGNVRSFAQAQLKTLLPLEVEIRPGVTLGHKHIPVSSVGSYIPGGRYPMFGSAQMSIIPAKVAGVKTIAACTPPVKGEGFYPATIHAMKAAGADRVFVLGGVPALAMMAFGIGDVEPVDILCGAGNKFVAEAKRQLFGRCGIDLLAGPTEILVLADDSADPALVACDLLGQAEHDPASGICLICMSEGFAHRAIAEVEKQLAILPTRDVASLSWRDNGIVMVAADAAEAVRISDDYAPEHLELHVTDETFFLNRLTNYGSLFIGEETTVAYGDKSIGTTRTRGFGLVVGLNTKTWVAQRDLPGGKTRRVKLGRYPEMTLTAARQAATRKLAAMLDGIDPSAERRARVREQQLKEHEAYTLRQALENHIGFMRSKRCAERSITTLRDCVERLLESWLDKPLIGVTRKDCIERHRVLTETRGPVAANRTLRCFRACWHSAQRLFEALPPHPVYVVYNKQSRKQSPIPWAELPAWWASVEAIDNTVRRDLNLLVLFTGLRSEDARTIRWEHVDFDKGELHRPKPKGGVDRAFTIPLAAHVLTILAKRKLDNRIRFNDDKGWVFPTRDTAGNVVHVRDARQTAYVEGENETVRKVTTAPTLHRLRDSFATACLESGVGMMETKCLMNHTLPGGDNVTQGYQRPSMEHLRGCVEKVAAFLLAKGGQNTGGVAGEKKSA